MHIKQDQIRKYVGTLSFISRPISVHVTKQCSYNSELSIVAML